MKKSLLFAIFLGWGLVSFAAETIQEIRGWTLPAMGKTLQNGEIEIDVSADMNAQGMKTAATSLLVSELKGKTINISCEAMASGVEKPESGLKFMLVTTTPEKTLFKGAWFGKSADFKWRKISFTVSIPENAKQLILHAGLQNVHGKVAFRNFRYTILPAAIEMQNKNGIKWILPGSGKMTGDNSFEIDVNDSVDHNPMNAAMCILPVEQFRGKKIWISAEAKADGLRLSERKQSYFGFKFMLKVTTPQKSFYPEWYSGNRTDFDWKNIGFFFSVPQDATSIELFAGVQNIHGKVAFRNIKVEEVNDFYIPPYQLPKGFQCQYSPEVASRAIRRGVMSPPPWKITEKDLEELASWGANLIRWQIIPANRGKTLSDPAEFERWYEGQLTLLEKFLPILERLDIAVIVDMHMPPGGRYKHTSESLPPGAIKQAAAYSTQFRMFMEKQYLDCFVRIWEKTAHRLKGKKIIWGYDLCNEPCQSAEVKFNYLDCQYRAAKAIRQIDPEIPLIVESNGMCSTAGYTYLKPLPFKNIIYQFHFYHPGEYTHQGTTAESMADVRKGKLISYQQCFKNGAGDMEKALAPVLDFQKKYDAIIFCGEFSAIRWAPGAADYLRDLIGLFEKYGFSWTYHAFREWHGWSVEHDTDVNNTAPVDKITDRKQILLDYFRKNKKNDKTETMKKQTLFFPVDLREICNASFEYGTALTPEMEWTNSHENDLSFLKSGRSVFINVPFEIPSSEKNGKSFIVLRGKERPAFPDSVSVKVKDRCNASTLVLLHAFAWHPGRIRAAATVTVDYCDGSQQIIPVTAGIDAGDWFSAHNLPNGVTGFQWKHSDERLAGLYASFFTLQNKSISKLTFKSDAREEVWMIAGATLVAGDFPLEKAFPHTLVQLTEEANGKIRHSLFGTNLSPQIQNEENVSISKPYAAMKFAYARMHDAPLDNANMPLVDIPAIFPLFHADENDPRNYRFAQTDDYLQRCIETGTPIFYRLGASIEHSLKKYNVNPPQNVEKWVNIASNIIRHYNDGWNNGFHHNIQYWEIWNEPCTGPKCWTGTYEEFCKFYVTAAKMLKQRFPDLKFGGPANSYFGRHSQEFIRYCAKEKAPLDFYSYHIYDDSPLGQITCSPFAVRRLLDKNGYGKTEIHLNEWHGYYIGKATRMSEEVMKGIDAGAFATFVLSTWHDTPLDAAAYYTGTAGRYGIFSFYDKKTPTTAYYALKLFTNMLDYQNRLKAQSSSTEVAVLAGKNANGEKACLISAYKPLRPIQVTGFKQIEKILLTDKKHSMEPIEFSVKDGILQLAPEGSAVYFIQYQ